MEAQLAFLENASASFADLEMNGDPERHLRFDAARIGVAERVDASVYNPADHSVSDVCNIIYERHADGRPPDRAYWVRRKLKKCIFGVVKACTILKFRNKPDVPWEVTEHRAAVKIMSWQKIRELRHVEDPQQEMAAMQHLSREGAHPHVMGALDILQDAEYLLMFMPFCSSGDLFSLVQEGGRFSEPVARYWFKQVLEGICHLQKMGVCHRDMSLENILVDNWRTSIIIDLGMCLRVPYPSDDGGITDVASGNLRLLMKPIQPCGKPNYMSPEIIQSDAPFDGFAIDLWACGVILFIMLVGLPPWEFAREEDPRYKMVNQGGLARMLRSWNRDVSESAADLLQKMLKGDPRLRLSLYEIMDHPWVTDDDGIVVNPPQVVQEGWRG